MSFIGTTDFLIEVGKGNVAGHSVFNLDAFNDAPASGGVTFSDLWGGGASSLVYPTAAETWEIVSDDTNDTSAGTGARTVLVTYLDDSYNQQTAQATMNGTTAVTLDTDHFRPIDVLVLTAGSGEANIGNITVQVSGAGAPRAYILPDFSTAKDGHYTVPLGFSAIIVNTVTFYSKNDDGQIRGKTRNSAADSPWLTGAVGCFYQSPFVIPTALPGLIPEKTDIRITATSFNGFAVTGFFEIMLIDNSVLP
jgi:hypothetical protein